jgi:hypothetical protein
MEKLVYMQKQHSAQDDEDISDTEIAKEDTSISAKAKD